MALAELLARLERDAASREDAVRERAREDVARLREEDGRASSRRRDAELAARRDARRARLDAELAEARSRARAQVLAAEHDLVDRAWSRAARLLEDLCGSPRLAALAPRLLEDALQHLEGLPCTARCAPELAPAVRAAAAGRALVTVVEDAGAPAGLLVESSDGRVLVDATLRARLERLRPEMAQEIVAEAASP